MYVDWAKGGDYTVETVISIGSDGHITVLSVKRKPPAK